MENPRAATYVVSGGSGFMVENSNGIPRFWSEGLSKAYQGVPVTGKTDGDAKGEEKWNPPRRSPERLPDIILLV